MLNVLIDHSTTDWNDELGILITISISTELFVIKVGASEKKKKEGEQEAYNE